MRSLLYITTQKTWCGSELLWCAAAERAIQCGHQVTIVMPSNAEVHESAERLVKLGARILFRPIVSEHTILRRVVWRLTGNLTPRLAWWVNHFRKMPDAICVSQGGSYCSINLPGLVPWLNSIDVPYVLICHSHRVYSLPDISYRSELKSCFKKALSVCFVAQENVNAAQRYLGIELRNALLVQNPVNLRDHNRVQWPSGEVVRIACVARYQICDKGQDLLLEALATPEWKQRDYELNLYGSGTDSEILKELIKLYGLSGKVRVAGFESDMRTIWGDHQLLILPSISEGTPISLIEAQLCGRPALVTRVDGNAAWVEDGKTGFIAEAATVHHLRHALEQAWQSRHRWCEMGDAARNACLAKRDCDPAGTLLALMLNDSICKTGNIDR